MDSMTKPLPAPNPKPSGNPPAPGEAASDTAIRPYAAAGGWFTCRVVRVGPAEDGHIYVGLSDKAVPPAFDWAWFYANDALKEEMLATALTAISTGYLVNAALVSSDPYSQINRLYLTVDS